MNSSLSQLADLQQVLDAISAPADISTFVSNQNVLVKEYPPPPAAFRTPELPSPKTPDTPPVDLVRCMCYCRGYDNKVCISPTICLTLAMPDNSVWRTNRWSDILSENAPCWMVNINTASCWGLKHFSKPNHGNPLAKRSSL